MSQEAWEVSVAALKSVTGPAKDEQLSLAALRNVKLDKKLPYLVAAARLRGVLGEALSLTAEPLPPEEVVRDEIAKMRRYQAFDFEPANVEEAQAWLKHLWLTRRCWCLQRLKLCQGDVVQLKDDDEFAEVASITEAGRIFFRGGRGFSEWPDRIKKVVAKRGDTTAKAKKVFEEARNTAARRRSSEKWSWSRSQDLREFVVETKLAGTLVNDLQRVIDKATDERPIQMFLQQHPQLLTSLLVGQERFCWSQKRLGDKFVPDFVIGDVDSLGVRWIVVELETPRSSIYLKDGKALDKFARQGVDQIRHWRNWIEQNIDNAQRPRAQDGLGLKNISGNVPGLVLVGRRQGLSEQNTDALRRQLRFGGIDVHTYDWLLACLRGCLRHSGPPASNRYLIHKGDSDKCGENELADGHIWDGDES